MQIIKNHFHGEFDFIDKNQIRKNIMRIANNKTTKLNTTIITSRKRSKNTNMTTTINTINRRKNSDITIVMSNNRYLVNPVPISRISAGRNELQYKAVGRFSHEESSLLNNSLRDSYLYINDTYKLLLKPSTHVLERIETILGDMEDSDLKTLISQIEQIQDKILSKKLVVLKENYLDTEKDHVLASVKEDDTYTFTVYDNFFDKKEFKDNRAGVIIHELCHLCDIEEGADMYDLDSAECLKNIILCLCEKLTLKQIRQEYARKQEPQDRDDDILTYNKDQPRHEAGTSEGGRWKKVGDKSEASSNGNKESSTKNEERDKPSDSKENQLENSTKKGNDAEKAKQMEEENERMKKGFDAPFILRDAINLKSFYKEVGFEPEGKGEKDVILEEPSSVGYIYYIQKRATVAGKQYMQETYPKGSKVSKIPHNNDGDALRHAFFSWMLSIEYGTFRTKSITDAHERSVVNDNPERAMDLKNNEIGRRASVKYPNLKTEKEVYDKLKELIKRKLLKTKPYSIYK